MLGLAGPTGPNPPQLEPLKIHRVRLKNNCHKLGTLWLTVGQHYWLYDNYVRLVKVTRKGFNLLDESTSRCLLTTHLYASGFGGKPIPEDRYTFLFWVPMGLRLYKSGVCTA